MALAIFGYLYAAVAVEDSEEMDAGCDVAGGDVRVFVALAPPLHAAGAILELQGVNNGGGVT